MRFISTERLLKTEDANASSEGEMKQFKMMAKALYTPTMPYTHILLMFLRKISTQKSINLFFLWEFPLSTARECNAYGKVSIPYIHDHYESTIPLTRFSFHEKSVAIECNCVVLRYRHCFAHTKKSKMFHAIPIDCIEAEGSTKKGKGMEKPTLMCDAAVWFGLRA